MYRTLGLCKYDDFFLRKWAGLSGAGADAGRDNGGGEDLGTFAALEPGHTFALIDKDAGFEGFGTGVLVDEDEDYFSLLWGETFSEFALSILSWRSTKAFAGSVKYFWESSLTFFMPSSKSSIIGPKIPSYFSSS